MNSILEKQYYDFMCKVSDYIKYRYSDKKYLKRKFEDYQSDVNLRMDKKLKIYHIFSDIRVMDGVDIEDAGDYFKEMEISNKRSDNLQKLNKFLHNSRKNTYHISYQNEIDSVVADYNSNN